MIDDRFERKNLPEKILFLLYFVVWKKGKKKILEFNFDGAEQILIDLSHGPWCFENSKSAKPQCSVSPIFGSPLNAN